MSHEDIDRIDPVRSRIMASVGSKDTAPEMAVRRYLHRLGFRYSLHPKRLPGRPDVVLSRHRTVVFVHGCFWHRHPGCRHATTPKTRRDFWIAKFARNVARDESNRRELARAGWRVMIVWECRTRKVDDLVAALEPLVRDRAR